MKRTKNQPSNATPGFAIQLTDSTDLGIAILIAEDAAGRYLPIAAVSTIGEAREIARDDMYRRVRDRERGEVVIPAVYKVWAHGVNCYLVAKTFDPSELRSF